MPSSFQIINLEGEMTDSFGIDVLEGLSKTTKSLPTRYLYDKKGSLLFKKIMGLKDYYPTACELEIIQRRKNDIAKIASKTPFRLIELGVGDAKKSKVLLKHFLENGLKFEYVLVDICKEIIEEVMEELKKEYHASNLTVIGLVAENSKALSWISKNSNLRNIGLFLGSSIGNLNPNETKRFLYEMWNAFNDDDYVFIGFDLKKDITLLEKAYNDPEGITREFNLNIIDRMNRELGSDFNRDSFYHHSFYNPTEGRMESWLITNSAFDVDVKKLKKTFHFDAWEGIHLEYSYKYSLKAIEELAEYTGFSIDRELFDSRHYFAEAIWKVSKQKAPILVGAK